ncbi:cyclin-G2 isoform X2 [Kryptolebias marmoratus]|uniref:Cyclin G2 n=1 Tax=Kryptolebias marmoratus TaxID=37003 RepID=A0A3Q3A2J0_KRYMA|nr:cyclin-G2 isoform X2 [Kryptolebias marmoratus]
MFMSCFFVFFYSNEAVWEEHKETSGILSPAAGSEMDAVRLMKELKVNYEQEVDYLPRETGLNLIESAMEGDSRISAKCRDAKVEDLWSLTSFFGYSTQTFVLAVNLLDRFLAMIKVQPKHLSCVSLSCLHMAAKVTEEECNLTPADELIRIGQCRFTVSDLCRMEKIVGEKLRFKSNAVTALTFLHLYHQIALSHATDRKERLSLEKLEAQLKACLCRISFSRAKPSVLALSLLRQEIGAIRSEDMLEIASHIQRHLKIPDGDLQLWSERVARCLSDYASPECSKPDHRKLRWIVSRRTAQNLHSHRGVPELPTIPEDCWDESESEDSSEDVMSSGEESLSSSLGSDAEGPFFPLHLRRQKPRPFLPA